MDRFSVWADWVLREQVRDDLLQQVKTAWSPDDQSFCFGSKHGEPEVLQLNFDVHADDFAAAATRARATVQDMADRLALPGHLAPLTAYTDTHWFRGG
jgi:hypothetical protein